MPPPTSDHTSAPCDRCGDRYRVPGLTLRPDGRRLCFLCARGIAVPPRRPAGRPWPHGPQRPPLRPRRSTPIQV